MRARHLVIVSSIAIACSSSPPSVNDRVASVSVAGTRVDGTVYGLGTFDVLVVPFDGQGQAVLEDGMSVQASVVTPDGVTARVIQVACVRNRERQPLAAGIVVDASSSMVLNDPDDESGTAPGRKRVVEQILARLQTANGDVALLSDFFGSETDPLRDLVCVESATVSPLPACIATPDSLTADKDALARAVGIIQNYSGTPLYQACLQMERILRSQDGKRRAMIVLSDGVPSESSPRETCLQAARSENVSIFTVGFGSGAEGPAVTCSAPNFACPIGWSCYSGTCSYMPDAVRGMRELSEATGGSYAPATDLARLDRLLGNMAYSDGYCTVTLEISGASEVSAGTPISGTVQVGNKGATASFQFLAPPR